MNTILFVLLRTANYVLCSLTWRSLAWFHPELVPSTFPVSLVARSKSRLLYWMTISLVFSNNTFNWWGRRCALLICSVETPWNSTIYGKLFSLVEHSTTIVATWLSTSFISAYYSMFVIFWSKLTIHVNNGGFKKTFINIYFMLLTPLVAWILQSISRVLHLDYFMCWLIFVTWCVSSVVPVIFWVFIEKNLYILMPFCFCQFGWVSALVIFHKEDPNITLCIVNFGK